MNASLRKVVMAEASPPVVKPPIVVARRGYKFQCAAGRREEMVRKGWTVVQG
jgi:hypothetical protein